MDLKNILKHIKFNENLITTIFGFVTIIILIYLIFSFFLTKRGQTLPPLEIGDESGYVQKYVVEKGDDLWKIAEKYTGSGYSWEKIAINNNIKPPYTIKEGDIISIPKDLISPTIQFKEESPTLFPDTSSPTPNIVSEYSNNKISKSKDAYTVKKGDSLWKIAEYYYKSGYNWVDIAKYNNISKPFYLEINQKLLIPDIEPKKLTDLSSKDVNIINSKTYTIKKGDSLWIIAVRAYGDGYKWTEIQKANNITNPNMILAGSTITIPR